MAAEAMRQDRIDRLESWNFATWRMFRVSLAGMSASGTNLRIDWYLDMKRSLGFAWIVGVWLALAVTPAGRLRAEGQQDVPRSAPQQPAPIAEYDMMCETDAAGPMCCDQSPSQNDSLHTVSNSLMTAGTAAVGLAAVGMLIKRRRGR